MPADKENWLATDRPEHSICGLLGTFGCSHFGHNFGLPFHQIRLGSGCSHHTWCWSQRILLRQPSTEKDPPQSFKDNTEDFIGWALGTVVGWLLR